MNTIHDMGGMHGFGPVATEAHEPVFHAEWEGRVYALVRLVGPWAQGRDWPGFRFALEAVPPEDYLRMSYYERWYWSLIERPLVAVGLVTLDEITAGHADTGRPAPQRLPSNTNSGGSRLPDPAAAYRVGETVRARELNPVGHTRLPRYTRDKVGVIHADNGVYALQDTDANGRRLGNFPQHVYTVQFSARELWGEQGHPNDQVYVDLWESYLEPQQPLTGNGSPRQ